MNIFGRNSNETILVIEKHLETAAKNLKTRYKKENNEVLETVADVFLTTIKRYEGTNLPRNSLKSILVKATDAALKEKGIKLGLMKSLFNSVGSAVDKFLNDIQIETANSIGRGSVGIGYKLKKFFSGGPKEVLKRFWELVNKLYKSALQNKKKTFGIFMVILLVGGIATYLYKKFPVIRKMLGAVLKIVKLPLYLVQKVISMFKKPEKVEAIYEQYVSDPVFRKLYDKSMKNLEVYMYLYSVA